MFVLLMLILGAFNYSLGQQELASDACPAGTGGSTRGVGEGEFSVVLLLTLKVFMVFPPRMLSFKHKKES